MLIAESGFSFNGKHCRDFGCMWNEDDGRVIVPETLRSEYEIAGRSGTVLLPGETRRCFNYSGVLTMMQEPASEQEAQTRLRTLAAWLSAGRCKLAMDYEPSHYYWAQLDGRQTWTAKDWFAGQLKVKFLCQPWAYAVEETTQAVAGVSSESTILGINLATGQPAPLRLTVTNTGSTAITGISIGDGVQLSGLHLAQGQSVTLDFEPPIGATFSTGDNALPFASAFRAIKLRNGNNTLQMRLAWAGSSGRSASIVTAARGRW